MSADISAADLAWLRAFIAETVQGTPTEDAHTRWTFRAHGGVIMSPLHTVPGTLYVDDGLSFRVWSNPHDNEEPNDAQEDTTNGAQYADLIQ